MNIKTCRKCLVEKSHGFFNKSKTAKDGLQSYCTKCTRAYSVVYKQTDKGRESEKKYREKYLSNEENRTIKRKSQADYKKNHREELRKSEAVHSAVYRAIKNGTLIRQPCETCGTTDNIHAHHDDYSKELEVRWLCIRHHKEAHRKPIENNHA